MKFPQDLINKIVLGDCVEAMKKIPDSSVDLVVTSPPYNLKNSTGNGMKDGRGGKWANAALVNGYHNYDAVDYLMSGSMNMTWDIFLDARQF